MNGPWVQLRREQLEYSAHQRWLLNKKHKIPLNLVVQTVHIHNAVNSVIVFCSPSISKQMSACIIYLGNYLQRVFYVSCLFSGVGARGWGDGGGGGGGKQIIQYLENKHTVP